MRRIDFSSDSEIVGGITWATSMPYGTLTSSARRWNSRDPVRAVVRSSIATTSPVSRRLSCAAEPRTRTSTDSGRSPTISRFGGRLRTASGTRRLRSTTCSPATVNQRTLARMIASTLRPRWRNGWYAISARRPALPAAACRAGEARSASAAARAAGRRSGRARARLRSPAQSARALRTRRPRRRRSPRSGRSPRGDASRDRGSTIGLTVSGRKHAAAATRFSCITTAPSCSGELGWKIVTSRS